ITLVIRGQDVRQRVKMNEATQTRRARSASLTERPERSTSWNAPRSQGWALKSCPARVGTGYGWTVAIQRIADASTTMTTLRIPRRYDGSTVGDSFQSALTERPDDLSRGPGDEG